MRIFLYILLIFLFLVIIFFLLRTITIAITMFGRVPYVPSNRAFKKAIKCLDIQDGEKILDIGSGDGRVLIYASKIYPEAQFVGIERNLFLVIYSNMLKFLLARKNISFKHGDVRGFDISDLDAIYLYLSPDFVDEILLKKELKAGCKVVSLHFPLGKEFSLVNKTIRYPVKYKGKLEYIFKWTNNEDSRREN